MTCRYRCSIGCLLLLANLVTTGCYSWVPLAPGTTAPGDARVHLSSGDVVEGTVLRTTTDSLYVRPASRFATPTMAFAATQLVSIDTHAFSPRRTAGYVALLSVGTFAVVAAAMNVAQASGGRTY